MTLHGNFERTPRVHRGPYEHSVPGMREDFLMQDAPPTRQEQIDARTDAAAAALPA